MTVPRNLNEKNYLAQRSTLFLKFGHKVQRTATSTYFPDIPPMELNIFRAVRNTSDCLLWFWGVSLFISIKFILTNKCILTNLINNTEKKKQMRQTNLFVHKAPLKRKTASPTAPTEHSSLPSEMLHGF